MKNKDSLNPFVPGLDFMQNWLKGASNTIPGMGQWVTPTLNPEELQKRIQELKTIQFWLEQNSRMVATTIQALEVQCMTLSTLQTMNIKMADLQASLKVKPESGQGLAADSRENVNASLTGAQPSQVAPEKPAAPTVDPMKWWSSLTEQFAQIATGALKEPVAAAAHQTDAPAAPAVKAKRGAAAVPQKAVPDTKPLPARKTVSPLRKPKK
jgi:hypothetical protein